MPDTDTLAERIDWHRKRPSTAAYADLLEAWADAHGEKVRLPGGAWYRPRTATRSQTPEVGDSTMHTSAAPRFLTTAATVSSAEEARQIELRYQQIPGLRESVAQSRRIMRPERTTQAATASTRSSVPPMLRRGGALDPAVPGLDAKERKHRIIVGKGILSGLDKSDREVARAWVRISTATLWEYRREGWSDAKAARAKVLREAQKMADEFWPEPAIGPTLTLASL